MGRSRRRKGSSSVKGRTRAAAYGSTARSKSVKVEGTSTTYGQDIRLGTETDKIPTPSSRSGRTGDRSVQGISARDVVVNIVEETEGTLETACGFVLTSLRPKTKTSVAVAAASVVRGRRARTSVTIKAPSFKFFNPPPTLLHQVPGNSPGRSLRRIPQSITSALVNNAARVTPNVIKRAVVVGSRIKNQPEVKKALEEAQKIDLTIALKSKESESLDFNTMKIPELVPTLNYNFFEEGEENIEEQEDPTFDPLLENRPVDTPRYIQLDWDTVNVSDPVTGTELEVKKNRDFRMKNFFNPKGVAKDITSRVPKSHERARAKIAPISRGGFNRRLVDIHSPEEGFRSIANKRLFNNSLSTTVREDKDSNIFSLPIKDVDKT